MLDFDENMTLVFEVLKTSNRRLELWQIAQQSGLNETQADIAIYRLSLRGYIKLESYNPSKRGGQAGVRMWNGFSNVPTYSIADELD